VSDGSILTLVEAAKYLREAMRGDGAFRAAMAATIERAGCVDIYEWVEAHPDYAIALAEEQVDVAEQIQLFEEKLKQADLS
jgi:hypothetical protein